jgi:hypothetical protein
VRTRIQSIKSNVRTYANVWEGGSNNTQNNSGASEGLRAVEPSFRGAQPSQGGWATHGREDGGSATHPTAQINRDGGRVNPGARLCQNGR